MPLFNPVDIAPAIAAHTAVATAHQDAPGLIATHTAIATAHQNAPGLIATHAGISDVHHSPVLAGGIVAGSYVGDGSDNRQITVGFKCSLVLVQAAIFGVYCRICYPNMTYNPIDGLEQTDCLLHGSDGFIVDEAAINYVSNTYYYWAVSE